MISCVTVMNVEIGLIFNIIQIKMVIPIPYEVRELLLLDTFNLSNRNNR